MNQFRLRGTWEEDPAPIPFPRQVPGRSAGDRSRSPADSVPVTKLSDRTRELMETVDEQFDRLQLNFNEFRELLDQPDAIPEEGEELDLERLRIASEDSEALDAEFFGA